VVDFCTMPPPIHGIAKQRDRRFDPALRPGSPALERLVREVINRASTLEKRIRRRRAEDQRIFETAIGALVANVVHAQLEGRERPIRIPLAKAELSRTRRPADFMTEAFRDTVRLLHSAEVVEMRIGEHHQSDRRQSTIRIGAWLSTALDALEVDFDDIARDPAYLAPPVVVRSRKVAGIRTPLPLPETAEARRLVDEMESINCWIAGARLEWTGEPLDTGRRHLVRVFNNGSLRSGGRLWKGFWMDRPRDQRDSYLRINGERIATLDFAHMGVTLAYSIVGAEPPESDLYAVPGTFGRREGVKKVLNAVLCAEQVPTRFPAGTRALFPSRARFAQVLEAISRHHPGLVPLFGQGVALQLQYLESEVMVRALLRLQQHQVVGLPVHDALLVPVSHAFLAKDVLESTFRTVTGIEGRVEVVLPPHPLSLQPSTPMG
jgi:hypothetical protein